MRTLTSGLVLAALALGTACSKDSSTGPTGGNSVLTLGTSVSISGGTDSERFFTVQVPAGAGALRVTITGGTGDADLAVRFNARPNELNYDCGSFGPTNNEECVVPNPSAGTWHILVLGFEAYSGAQLRAELTSAPTATVLTSGVALTNQSGAESSSRYFSINVPAGATSLTVTTSGGTGDVDLLVRHNAFPTMMSYACESSGGSNSENCTINSPAAGTWYVMLYGFDAYSGVTLTATVAGP
jgi:serine protease